MNKKYQIFISSTYEDLKEERSKVVATILKANHFPIGMEMFSADNVEQWEQIKRTIDSSDYYVLIIKKRYGSLTKEGISYTEKEFNYATQQKIPVLAFVVSDEASISNKDIEDNPDKMAKLKSFVKRVTTMYPCDFWKNTDELCTSVSQALQKQFENNQRIGWIKNNGIATENDIKNMNEDTLFQMRKEIEYELLRRQSDIRLSYDFWDSIDEKLWRNLKKQTYIDNFNRQIVLEFINEKSAKVTISTQIEFVNVKNGIRYYSANPRFETEEQAISYCHEEYNINGKSYLYQIEKKISKDENRQFPYLVSNEIPLIYEKGTIIINHKISYVLKPEEFLHVYQLIFPCRSFWVTIMLKNNIDEKYRIRTGTFSSFNVHTYENDNKYRKEYRKGDIGTITISKWALPGSGYTVVLQKTE